MNPSNPSALITDNLFNEVAHTILSLDTVYALYGATVVVAAALWLIGVVVFGNARSSGQPGPHAVAGSSERITPAVP
ncbi:MAG: hypothetical protein JRG93_06475 [Deltaproteobacteria bacterium]|nr:hypothetical protein [Deltaproteobacteria bacterium]MBW2403189.1 hypothetical protein [Deltaproteobacteria bacterium]